MGLCCMNSSLWSCPIPAMTLRISLPPSRPQYKTSTQAKRHKLSVLITSLTNFTSLAFKTLINFYHWITFITRSIYSYSYYRLKRFRTLSSHFKLCLRSGLEAAPCQSNQTAPEESSQNLSNFWKHQFMLLLKGSFSISALRWFKINYLLDIAEALHGMDLVGDKGKG